MDPSVLPTAEEAGASPQARVYSADQEARTETHDAVITIPDDVADTSMADARSSLQSDSDVGSRSPAPSPRRVSLLDIRWRPNRPSRWDNMDTGENDTDANLDKLVKEVYESGNIHLLRFERLYLLELYRQQNELVEFDEHLGRRSRLMSDETLSDLLIKYANTIEAFNKLKALPRPDTQSKKMYELRLANMLDQRRYLKAAGKTNLIDLSENEPSRKIDKVRTLLQRILPTGLLDEEGKRRQEVEWAEYQEKYKADKATTKKAPKNDTKKRTKQSPLVYDKEEEEALGASNAATVKMSKKQAPYISPIVNRSARVAVAIIGGIFLLAPMAALAYIDSKVWCIVTTVLFVILFSIMVALASEASNQELLGATAAYTAVLVVFVGSGTQGGLQGSGSE